MNFFDHGFHENLKAKDAAEPPTTTNMIIMRMVIPALVADLRPPGQLPPTFPCVGAGCWNRKDGTSFLGLAWPGHDRTVQSIL
jgi:hypothetical protein